MLEVTVKMDRLQELQSKNDAELNELAAIKLLWNGIVNVPSDDWKPSTDMNCAMCLEKELKIAGYRFHLSTATNGNYIAIFELVDEMLEWECADKEASRAITIAAILAKEGKE